MKPSEQTINDLLNIIPAVLYEYVQNQDGSGIFRYVSPTSKAILGYPSKYFIGHDISRFFKILHFDDRERLEREDAETVNDSFFSSDGRIVLPSGEIRHVWICSKPARISEEGLVTWIGCAVDITTQKQTENDLKNALDRVKELNQSLEQRVKERTEELEQKAHRLFELNSALNILLEKREEDKKQLEQNVLKNIQVLIQPLIDNLSMSGLNKIQKGYLDALELFLIEIVSPFSNNINTHYQKLTPSEIRVANLIRQGRSTKVIALLLNTTERAIKHHRRGIRMKLGLTHKKINLSSFLATLN